MEARGIRSAETGEGRACGAKLIGIDAFDAFFEPLGDPGASGAQNGVRFFAVFCLHARGLYCSDVALGDAVA